MDLKLTLLLLALIQSNSSFSCIKGTGGWKSIGNQSEPDWAHYEYGQDVTEFQYCEPTTTYLNCGCHNIKINGTGGLTSGTCDSTESGLPWCFVIGQNSSCSDKKLSSMNQKVKKILGNGHKWPGSFRGQNLNFYDIYYSYEACQNEEQKSAELEDFLPCFGLTGASTVHNDQDLNISTPEDCQANCFYETRCQAWTLQIQNGTYKCTLKKGTQGLGLCSNIQGVRLENSNAISGFTCYTEKGLHVRKDIQCWSTNGNYPFRFCPKSSSSTIESDSRGQGNGISVFKKLLSFASGTASIATLKALQRRSSVVYRFINGKWRPIL